MDSRARASFGVGRPTDGWRVDLESPQAVEETRTLADVTRVVDWADQQAQRGRWVVLLLSYEAAPAFDPALAVRTAAGPVPLAWAASYEADAARHSPLPAADPAGPADAVAWAPAIDESRFRRDIARVLAHIAAGDTYQVNYTFALTAPFAHDPWAWFARCARQAGVPYPAIIDTGPAVVMSLSPELFVQRRGDRVRARPMKGTTRRGRWLGEDQHLADTLVRSEKARAENVMIVDLLRNDIGRVATIGSVHTSALCALEQYPTVWQMTSTVDATLRPGVGLLDLLRAVFPCGSVTGAPKVRTMELIAGLEQAPRGIYTGAICLLQPGGDLVASVPIRTAVFDRASGSATFNVGAGITADSTAAEEWAECLAKAHVVRPPAVPDDAVLFETMRLQDGDLRRRAAHLERIRASARLFGWPEPDPDALTGVLDALVVAHLAGSWRARLYVDRQGGVRAEAVPFVGDARRWRVGVAAAPVDTRSPLLFNKTTRRDIYDEARAASPGMDDVLLWNGRGELTEGTLANLVLELDGVRVTPPLSCGLLPGVFRQELLTRGEVQERVVRVDEVARATRLWLVNSLREWIDIELVVPS
jgi:para-aminobenzoate synthetase/4-amino-4-deoxychorismate lyase